MRLFPFTIKWIGSAQGYIGDDQTPPAGYFRPSPVNFFFLQDTRHTVGVDVFVPTGHLEVYVH